MTAPAANTVTPSRDVWVPNWNTYAMGTAYQVNPDLKLILEPITRNVIGKIIIGHWIVGLEGDVTVECSDINLGLMQQMCPWWTSGSIPLTPAALNQDSYQYAQLLNLHPLTRAADVTADINLLKTVPLTPVNIKRGAGPGSTAKDDMYAVKFEIYPDRSKLFSNAPTLVYGYIGAPPA